MNSKLAKKIRKEVRKTAVAEFGGGMEMLRKLIRRRPGWFPKAIWILLFATVFKLKYLKIIYKYL